MHGIRHGKWNMEGLTQKLPILKFGFVCCYILSSNIFFVDVQFNIQYVKLNQLIFKNLENGKPFPWVFFILFQKKKSKQKKTKQKRQIPIKRQIIWKKNMSKKKHQKTNDIFLSLSCRHHLHAKCCFLILFSIVVTLCKI